MVEKKINKELYKILDYFVNIKKASNLIPYSYEHYLEDFNSTEEHDNAMIKIIEHYNIIPNVEFNTGEYFTSADVINGEISEDEMNKIDITKDFVLPLIKIKSDIAVYKKENGITEFSKDANKENQLLDYVEKNIDHPISKLKKRRRYRRWKRIKSFLNILKFWKWQWPSKIILAVISGLILYFIIEFIK